MTKEYRPWDLTETVESQTFDELNAACATGWHVTGEAFDVNIRGFGVRRFCILERDIPDRFNMEPSPPPPLENADLMGKLGSAMSLIDHLARHMYGLRSILADPCSACDGLPDRVFCMQCSTCIRRADDVYESARKLFPSLPVLEGLGMTD